MKIIFHDDTEKTTSVLDCTGYRCKELHLEPKDFLRLAQLVESDPRKAVAVLTQLSGRTGTSRMYRPGEEPENLIHFSAMEQQMTATKTDFFFGEIKRHADSGLTLNWPALQDTAKLVSSELFTKQLNRLLRDVGEPVAICDGSSSPNFYSLLDCLNGDDIACIELYTDHLVPGSDDRLVLSCKIYLLEGILDFKTSWMADNQYASQLIDSLLLPIHRHGLKHKVFINGGLGKKIPIANDGPQTELGLVFGKLHQRCSSSLVESFIATLTEEKLI